MNEVTEGLEKAAALIEQGWCQGQYSDFFEGKENYCPVGALGALGLSPFLRGQMYDRLAKHVPKNSQSFLNSITHFNDQPSTTKEDILLLFKKAIHDVESNG